jgi:arginase
VQRLEDPDIGRMKKPRLVSAVCERVGKEVGDIAKKGWLPLTLGGDHSLVSERYLRDNEADDQAMGTVAGTKSKYPDACVIWVSRYVLLGGDS